jgi:hypothetical protein
MRGAEHLEFEAVSPGQCPKARASESSCTVNPSNRHCEVRPGNEPAMRGEALRCAAKLARLIRGAPCGANPSNRHRRPACGRQVLRVNRAIAPTLRSYAAGSQDELRCGAIQRRPPSR